MREALREWPSASEIEAVAAQWDIAVAALTEAWEGVPRELRRGLRPPEEIQERE